MYDFLFSPRNQISKLPFGNVPDVNMQIPTTEFHRKVLNDFVLCEPDGIELLQYQTYNIKEEYLVD